METLILRLFPYGREVQDLVLHPHEVETSLLEAVQQPSSYVFCDHEYSAEIVTESSNDISNLSVFVNGQPIETKYQEDGKITFCDEAFGKRIFTDCYGFVQISISFSIENQEYSLESDYIQVMVRKGKQNDSVRRMAEYIYTHNESFLYGSSVLPKDKGGLKPDAIKTVESRILLLKTIYQVYERNYRYFKVNSRFTTVPQETVDNFEKMRYASSRTVQYIAQHPEELQKVNSHGIKVGNRQYIPKKTLITNSIASYDIYENRVIIGFLHTIYHSIGELCVKLEKVIKSYSGVPLETSGYVSSSYFFYISTINVLKVNLADLIELKGQYAQVVSAYSSILKVEDLRVVVPPKPTHIFLSVPQYRQIYDCIVSWFKMGIYDLDKEKYMLSFIRGSTLYEVYVVAKLISHLCNLGYSLISSRKTTYTFTGRSFYRNTFCNNTFKFKSGNTHITVWYQPVIYNSDKSTITGIGLYRNTSLSLPKASLEDSVGTYYSPDFLIKVETEEKPGARYLISDAKFSTVPTVKLNQVVPLVYKYLFSISPISADDQLVGLCIFNGQSDSDKDRIIDIYDRSLTPGKIHPFADIFTLTENEVPNLDTHKELLDTMFRKLEI